MPEGAEVDLDKVRELIDSELEHDGGRLLRSIALTTAFLAGLAAVASLLAGSTVNEALVLKSEATRLQAQASDQWAYYQAKGIKAAIAGSAASAYAAAGKPMPDTLKNAAARYTLQQEDIAGKARELEKERDARDAEAGGLLGRHHRYAYAVAMLQVAIALGAVAALTRRRPIWVFSMAIGVAGVVFLVVAMLS
ncbi:MAG: DUF4337 domain-containing protein [Gemmatimonadaceae bacterium]|nr:DUF4337 domain-containing protein [Gemmatimonadaceae bacterium]NUO93939.1 DUF4337 domain-containing protein [Gemmatimonadaceae bacterium]NUP71335.1 DUF4337 domain-containing protein [Gemmatimonadaceae bacterium]NUR33165.1 DUF4337 domain-containing protein [Gemmatimonadaceae bacterium]NUS33520.1 DUF4337 domain-containing protein [Gemmatimonadaceae bacterium]